MRLISVTILAVILFSCKNDNQSRLTLLFDNGEGLQTGSEVYLRGIKVGEVTHIDFLQNKIVTDIRLEDSVRIPVNSRFIINRSVFNHHHITIEPSNYTSFLTSKDTIIGEYNKRQFFDDVASDSTRQRKIQESVDKIGEGFKGLIEVARDTVKS